MVPNPVPPRPLRVLIVDDSPADAEILHVHLEQAGFAVAARRVDSEAAYLVELSPGFDLILSDYSMPGFGGLQALRLLKDRALAVPFFIVSGTIGEELAVEIMRLGAMDCLRKDQLLRLPAAVERALEQGRLRRERAQAEKSLGLFRTLVDQSSDAFEVLDLASGRYLDVNETGCREFGYSREELLGMSVADVDPNASTANWSEFVWRLRADGSASGEGIHQRKDGTRFPIEFNARLVRLDREYLVSVVRNITDRKQGERELRERLEELQRWHNLTTDREERVLELKNEVNVLLERLGEPRRYGEERR